MQRLTKMEVNRIRQAVGLQATSLRKQNSPVTRSVEDDLGKIDNKLREIIVELDRRSNATIEVTL